MLFPLSAGKGNRWLNSAGTPAGSFSTRQWPQSWPMQALSVLMKVSWRPLLMWHMNIALNSPSCCASLWIGKPGWGRLLSLTLWSKYSMKWALAVCSPSRSSGSTESRTITVTCYRWGHPVRAGCNLGVFSRIPILALGNRAQGLGIEWTWPALLMALAVFSWLHHWPGQTLGPPLVNEQPHFLITLLLEKHYRQEYGVWENVVSMLYSINIYWVPFVSQALQETAAVNKVSPLSMHF